MINIPKLLISNEHDNILFYIKEVVNEFKIETNNVHWIETNDESHIYNLLFQLSLFEELEIFIINLDSFYNDKKVSDDILKIISKLHKSPISNLVYFYTKYNNQFIKKPFKEFFVLEGISEKNKLSYIEEYVKKLNLSLPNEQIKKINKKMINNKYIIQNEINKLNSTNLDFIDDIICDYQEINPFQITEIILKKKTRELKTILDELLVDNNAYHKLFNIISSKLVQLCFINDLSKTYNVEKIAEITNKSLYSVRMDINLINSVSIFTVKYYIDIMYRIEKDIRKNNLDPIKVLKLNLLKG